MKNTYVFQNKTVRRVALFCSFENLFNVWLNRRQLDSHICFCFGLLYFMSGILWKIPLHPHKRMKQKRANDTLYFPSFAEIYLTYTIVYV